MGKAGTLQALTAALAAGVLVALAGWGPDRTSPVGAWRTVERRDGSVGRAFGAGIDAPGCVSSPAAAERAARAFVAAHVDHIAPGARTGDFAVSSNVEERGLRVVAFGQRTGDTPILGASLAVYCKRDRIFALSSSAVANPPAPRAPRIAPDRAGDAAASRVIAGGDDGARAAEVDGPFVRGTDTVYRADVVTADPARRFTVFVDVSTGAVIDAVSRVRQAEGTVLYQTPTRHPGDDPVDHPAVRADMVVDGAPTTSDAGGLVTWPTASVATVEPTTNGAYAAVTDAQFSGPPPPLALAPGGSAVWDTPADPALSAARVVYVHVNAARARAMQIAPELAWLDQPVVATVNSTGICNAASDGDELLFFRAGSNGIFSCQNAGSIVDLVYHEYAHSLHFHAIVPDAGKWDPALTEGLADYFAASMTGDPGWARGFLYGERPWRHIDPSWFEVAYPSDYMQGNPHGTGRILSGALWDLRTQLIADMGEQAGRDHADYLAYQVMRLSDSILTAYVDVLAADDDDGDLDNGTPNGCAIDLAFARHGLGDAPPPITPMPPVRDGREVTLPVVGEPSACAPADIASAHLEWYLREDPGTNGVEPMSLAGDGRDRVASLPDVPDGTAVRFRVAVEMSDTTQRAFPDNPADPHYDAYVGPTEPLYCTTFSDSNDVASWDHDWENSSPDGENGGGDPRRGHSPTLVLGTYNGRGNDDGMYHALESLSATSPSIDTRGYPGIRLQYYRWLDVEDGRFDRARILANGAEVWSNAATSATEPPVHHRDREWRFHDVDLSEHVVDDRVQVAFALDTDATNQFAGWTIDTLCIVGTGEPATAGDAGSGALPDAAGAGGGDADVDMPGPGPGGCGCASGGRGETGGAPALIALVLAVLVATRRRASSVATSEAASPSPGPTSSSSSCCACGACARASSLRRLVPRARR